MKKVDVEIKTTTFVHKLDAINACHDTAQLFTGMARGYFCHDQVSLWLVSDIAMPNSRSE